MVHLKVLSQYSPEKTKENQENPLSGWHRWDSNWVPPKHKPRPPQPPVWFVNIKFHKTEFKHLNILLFQHMYIDLNI